MDNRREVYRDLCIAAQRAYGRGIQTGSGGNLSARDILQDQMIVKASGGSFADCTEKGQGFVITDYTGKVVGDVKITPTREVLLHGMLYRMLKNIGGIMHCHSPWAISYAYCDDILPMITLHGKLKLGYDIPILDISSPMVMEEHMPLVEKLFQQIPGLTAFILRGHGIVAVGKDVLEAEHTAELIEETAQIATLKKIINK